MKKFLALFLFIMLLISPCVFAQSAKIIDAKGKVSVKKDTNSTWQTAKINMLLEKNAEIQTKSKSECTLAFDEELKNILTVKENSYVKLENIKPGKINLPEGRVFSLIENIKEIEKFEIRTPTVVAGVMGTGLGVASGKSGSTVLCFQDNIYTKGLDKKGNVTSKKDLSAGFGMDVDENGQSGDLFKLDRENLNRWNEFKENITEVKENLRTKETPDLGLDSLKDTSSLGELRQERTDTRRETILEERRQRQEESQSQQTEQPSPHHEQDQLPPAEPLPG